MVTADHVGRSVIIRAADSFYAFIDGWVGTLDGFASGQAVIKVPGHEDGQDVDKTFLVPPEQVELHES